MTIDLVTYESQEPLSEGSRFLTFIKIPKSKPKGFCRSPVYFEGESYQSSREKAIAFWDDETAKLKASRERIDKLNASKRKKTDTKLNAN